jgi:transcriptional regulator with XRE-family HTH domain
MTTKSYFARLEKQFGTLTFGDVLKAWRQSDDLSQIAFSKRIGISPQNLNDLEKGRRIPTPLRAARIARRLNLPEVSLIQIAIRDSLHKDGFNFDVKLETA